jgi:hypothetical protein
MRWQGYMHRKGNDQGNVKVINPLRSYMGKEAALPEQSLAIWHSKNCGNNESDTFS